jgi:hypothetical protein
MEWHPVVQDTVVLLRTDHRRLIGCSTAVIDAVEGPGECIGRVVDVAKRIAGDDHREAPERRAHVTAHNALALVIEVAVGVAEGLASPREPKEIQEEVFVRGVRSVYLEREAAGVLGRRESHYAGKGSEDEGLEERHYVPRTVAVAGDMCLAC